MSGSGKARRFLGFLGPKVVRLLALGGVTGLLVFFAEVLFAYGLQAFLHALGVASGDVVKLPAWVPTGSFKEVLAFIFLIAVGRGVLYWFQFYFQGATLESFKFEQRTRLLWWSFRSTSVSVSRVSSLFNERANQAGNAVMYLQMGALQATICALIGISLFLISARITIAVLTLSALVVLPMKWLSRKIRDSGSRLAQEWDRTNHRLMVSIKNLLLLRIYGVQYDEEKKAQDSLKGYLGHMLSYQASAGLSLSFPQVFGVGLICLVAIVSHKESGLKPGVLISYFYLFLRFLQNLSAFSLTVSTVAFGWPQLRALFDWWEHSAADRSAMLQVEQQGRIGGRLIVTGPIGWKLSKLGFTYPSAEVPVISSLDLTLGEGQTLVVVGPSGVGKSTLLNLLLGELSPTEGSIKVTLDGVERSLSDARQSLLPNIGYVGAESFLIEGTIKENLLYGLEKALSDQDIDQAIRLAECQFVYEFKAGLGYRITEQGQGLSAGQKQRLCLARALLRSPKALILDEATANLDQETEKRLVETLAQLKRQMTLIIVTHRLELTKLADQQIRLSGDKSQA